MFGFNKTDTKSDNKTDIDTPVQIEEELLSADEESFAGDSVDAVSGSEAVSHQLSYLSKGGFKYEVQHGLMRRKTPRGVS